VNDLERAEKYFDRGEYFECHEVLEEVWKKTSGKKKVLLQGLIQVAAGLHKLKQGHPEGAAKLFARAKPKLKIPAPPDLAQLKKKMVPSAT